jgi:hypothetical protein
VKTLVLLQVFPSMRENLAENSVENVENLVLPLPFLQQKPLGSLLFRESQGAAVTVKSAGFKIS